jgi:hypothetical protein
VNIQQRGMFTRDVTLDIAGIRRGKTVISWSALDHYRYDWQDWSRPGDFVAVGTNDKTIRIAPVASQWVEAADAFIRGAHAHLRQDPFFEPFTMHEGQLGFAGRALRLVEIEHVEIAAFGSDVLVIVHERNAEEWARCEPVQIANFWLWLVTLVERDVSIRSTLPLHLPPALARIGELVAMESRMPTARLV